MEVVRIRRHRKKFAFAISSLWWVSCIQQQCCCLFWIRLLVQRQTWNYKERKTKHTAKSS